VPLMLTTPTGVLRVKIEPDANFFTSPITFPETTSKSVND
jgi:hypothetical protein